MLLKFFIMSPVYRIKKGLSSIFSNSLFNKLTSLVYYVSNWYHLFEFMKSELKQQYEAIRSTILTNVRTIGNLVDQSNKLKELVEKIKDDNGNSDIKTSLETEIKNIEGSIEKLVSQTETLFDKYSEFVDTVFSK